MLGMAMKTGSVLLVALCITVTGCRDDSYDQAKGLATQAAWLMEEGKYSEALPLLQKASDLRPSCAEYHVGIAMVSIRLNDHQTARVSYQKALRIFEQQSQYDPERVDDHFMVLVSLNREDEAREVLRKARKRFKDSPSMRSLVDDIPNLIKGFRQYRVNEPGHRKRVNAHPQ